MAQFSIQHESEIQDGPTYIVHANHLIDNFNGIISDFADRMSLVTTSSQTVASAVIFNGLVTLSSTVAVTGSLNLSRATDPGSPANGMMWYDSTNSVWKAVTGGVTTSFGPGLFPNYFKGTACPVYASASTFTIAYISARDTVLGSSNILVTSPVTVDISTNALNGCSQSASLSGSIGTGGVSSTTITGTSTTFTTDFIVGDVIWTASGGRRITAIASDTSLTVESAITLTNGTAYKRNGEAPNTWYNVYIVYDVFGSGNSGVLLDTRNVAAGNSVPNFSTYLYQQLPFAVRNDGSSNIIPFYVSNWGHRPSIFFRDFETGTSTYRVLNGGISTTAFTNPGGGANIDLSSFVPKISKEAFVNGQMSYASGSGTWSTYLKSPDSASTVGKSVVSVNSVGESIGVFNERVPINSSQQLAYKVDAQSVTIYCQGFTVTEVQ